MPRRQTLVTLDRRLRQFERHRVRRAFGGAAVRITVGRPRLPLPRRPARDDPPSALALTAVLASYAGHLRHGAAWRAWQQAWRRRPWLPGLFRLTAWAPRARWAAPALWSTRFGHRYQALSRAAGDDALVFVRIGRYSEFLGRQRLLAQRALGLRALERRRLHYGLVAGFPASLAPRCALRALGRGLAVVVAGDQRRVGSALHVLLPARQSVIAAPSVQRLSSPRVAQ